jgi:hypothetical protein
MIAIIAFGLFISSYITLFDIGITW